MNHIEQLQQGRSVSGLKKLTAAALGALALMGSAPAMAAILDFNDQSPDIFFGGNSFSEGGYTFLVNDTTAPGGGGGLAGVFLNGGDEYSCDVAACPVGNPTIYYGGVNDASVTLSRDGGAFQLSSLKYAFLPPVAGLAPGSYGELTLFGTLLSGGTVSTSIQFPALVTGGYSPFALSALDSAFTSGIYTSITIGACVYLSETGCSYPAINQAQFAIDDLNVTAAVPEPETYAMMGLGLGVLALVRRRNNRRAATVKSA
jgi:hypothetical protein